MRDFTISQKTSMVFSGHYTIYFCNINEAASCLSKKAPFQNNDLRNGVNILKKRVFSSAESRDKASRDTIWRMRQTACYEARALL